MRASFFMHLGRGISGVHAFARRATEGWSNKALIKLRLKTVFRFKDDGKVCERCLRITVG